MPRAFGTHAQRPHDVRRSARAARCADADALAGGRSRRAGLVPTDPCDDRAHRRRGRACARPRRGDLRRHCRRHRAVPAARRPLAGAVPPAVAALPRRVTSQARRAALPARSATFSTRWCDSRARAGRRRRRARLASTCQTCSTRRCRRAAASTDAGSMPEPSSVDGHGHAQHVARRRATSRRPAVATRTPAASCRARRSACSRRCDCRRRRRPTTTACALRRRARAAGRPLARPPLRSSGDGRLRRSEPRSTAMPLVASPTSSSTARPRVRRSEPPARRRRRAGRRAVDAHRERQRRAHCPRSRRRRRRRPRARRRRAPPPTRHRRRLARTATPGWYCEPVRGARPGRGDAVAREPDGADARLAVGRWRASRTRRRDATRRRAGRRRRPRPGRAGSHRRPSRPAARA